MSGYFHDLLQLHPSGLQRVWIAGAFTCLMDSDTTLRVGGVLAWVVLLSLYRTPTVISPRGKGVRVIHDDGTSYIGGHQRLETLSMTGDYL